MNTSRGGELTTSQHNLCLQTALTIASAQYTRFSCGSFHGTPLALPPSLSVKATCCLTLSPVTSRLKNFRASHHFCGDMVSCPFTVHSTFLSAPSRLGQGELFPQTHGHPLWHPQIGSSYTDLKC